MMSSRVRQCEINISHGPIKRLFIKTLNNEVLAVSMLADNSLKLDVVHNETACELAKQLSDYAAKSHNAWSVNLLEQGTEFQRRVWLHLQTIPLGETRTYGQVAAALSSSARAVGNACRANPYLLVVPCHRVVAKSGIGGFAGENDGKAVAIKRWLLEHERK